MPACSAGALKSLLGLAVLRVDRSGHTRHPSLAENSLGNLLAPPPAGDTEEQQTKPERALSGSLERQVGEDSPPVSLAEMLQVSPLLLIRTFSHFTLLLVIILRPKVWLNSQ